MNIKIQTLHFDADKKLEEFIESRVGKVINRHNDIISAEITLKLEKSQENDNKVAEIKIEIPGNDLYAKRQAKTFEESTDIAMEAIKRQLKKYKDKKINN